MLSRDEILTAHAAGPEALAQWVETIQSQMGQQIATLTARVAEREARLNKDSHNSSKPPSSDPAPDTCTNCGAGACGGGRCGLSKKPARSRSLRRRSGKTSGGQPGHPGTNLKLLDHPTERHAWAPAACRGCGPSLAEAEVVQRERRQTVDLPQPRLEIVEHEAQHKLCPADPRITWSLFLLRAGLPPSRSSPPHVFLT
jgi:transposase